MKNNAIKNRIFGLGFSACSGRNFSEYDHEDGTQATDEEIYEAIMNVGTNLFMDIYGRDKYLTYEALCDKFLKDCEMLLDDNTSYASN